MSKLYMIKDFIEWAFYGNIVGKRIDIVNRCYSIYCSNFGIEEQLENKELQTLICQECNCMLSNGVYKRRKDVRDYELMDREYNI